MISNISEQKMKKSVKEHTSQTIANIFQVGEMELPVLVFCQENRTNSAGFFSNSHSLEVSFQYAALNHSHNQLQIASSFVWSNN